MKYQKGFAPLLLIILIAVALAGVGGGYVIFKNKQPGNNYKETTQNLQNSQSDTQNSQADTTDSQPITEARTSDWQTYKNDEFGMQIKYPSDFSVDPMVSSDLMLLGMKSKTVKDFLFSIVINRNPSEELQNETLQQTCDKYRQAESSEGKLLECKSVTVNGVEYTKVVQELKTNGGRGITLQGQSRSMFLMVTIYIPASQIGALSNTIEGVLSTIKF